MKFSLNDGSDTTRPIFLEMSCSKSRNKNKGSRGVRLHENNSSLHDILWFGKYTQPLLSHSANNIDYVPPINNRIGERKMTVEEKRAVLYDIPPFGADLCGQLYDNHYDQLSKIKITDEKLLNFYNLDIARDSLFGDDEEDEEFYTPGAEEISALKNIETLGDLVDYGRLRNGWSTDYDHSCRCFVDVVEALMRGDGLSEMAHSGFFVVLDGYNHCFGETVYNHGDYFDALKCLPAHRLSLLNCFLPEGSSFDLDPDIGPREEDAIRREDPHEREQNPHLKPSKKMGTRILKANVEKLNSLSPGDLKTPAKGGLIIAYDHTKPIKSTDSVMIQKSLEGGVLSNAEMINVKRYERDELEAIIRGYVNENFGQIKEMKTDQGSNTNVDELINDDLEMGKIEMATGKMPFAVRDRFLNDVV